MVTVLFALMFKYLPDVAVAWQQVIVGAIGTALLFTIGKFLLGIYLGKASVGSTYGAAGSLVAVVVWIYYSAQIFFFGAEFTNLYADAPRKRSAPAQPPRVWQESESKAASPESGHPAPAKRMEGAATVDIGLKIEAPVPMARPLSSTSAVYPTDIPVSVQPPITVRQTAAESVGMEATAMGTRPQRMPTPRLLLAMVIGFGLGRMTRTRVENRSDR